MKKIINTICLILSLCLLVTLNATLVSCDDSSDTSAVAEDTRYYILNTSTKKYHRTNCSYLPSSSNSKKVYRSSMSSYRDYSPCGHCDP